MEWKDGTLHLDGLRIVVTNKHIHNPGVWVMHVREFDWSCKRIGVPDAATEEEAQDAALEVVYKYVKELLWKVAVVRAEDGFKSLVKAMENKDK